MTPTGEITPVLFSCVNKGLRDSNRAMIHALTHAMRHAYRVRVLHRKSNRNEGREIVEQSRGHGSVKLENARTKTGSAEKNCLKDYFRDGPALDQRETHPGKLPRMLMTAAATSLAVNLMIFSSYIHGISDSKLTL